MTTSKISLQILTVLLLLLLAISPSIAKTAIEKHGALAVKQGKIVNQKESVISLAGPSFFWSNDGWQGEAFYNSEAVSYFVNEWKAPLIRAAIGVDGKGSYIVSPESNFKKAEVLIDAAIKEGIYVIIDWHSHHAEDHPEQAVDFFQRMANKYGHLPNIIYEIYNEPLNNTDWDTVVKPYAETVISAIREIDSDNLILVGSPTWSQDVDIVAKNPIKGFNNIAYTIHFYAGTHKQGLRDKAQTALDAGLALFVSEWGTVNANGDGAIDKESVSQWMDFIKQNDLSHCSWSVTNKKEGSAIFKPNTQTNGNWQQKDLTANGEYLRTIISSWEE